MKQPLELASYKYSSTVFNSWERLASLVTMDETTDQNSKPECSTQALHYSSLPQKDILCGNLVFTADLEKSGKQKLH